MHTRTHTCVGECIQLMPCFCSAAAHFYWVPIHALAIDYSSCHAPPASCLQFLKLATRVARRHCAAFRTTSLPSFTFLPRFTAFSLDILFFFYNFHFWPHLPLGHSLHSQYIIIDRSINFICSMSSTLTITYGRYFRRCLLTRRKYCRKGMISRVCEKGAKVVKNAHKEYSGQSIA